VTLHEDPDKRNTSSGLQEIADAGASPVRFYFTRFRGCHRARQIPRVGSRSRLSGGGPMRTSEQPCGWFTPISGRVPLPVTSPVRPTPRAARRYDQGKRGPRTGTIQRLG
jgi:hypothetical protein